MEMEQRLADYRARKRQEDAIPSLFQKVKRSISPTLETGTKPEEKKLLSSPEPPDARHAPKILHRSTLVNSNEMEFVEPDSNDHQIGCPNTSWLTIAVNALYFLLWATLYVIAIKLEFGTVFLIISALYFIWKNTGTGPKKKGEVSAYSVFNPNCEAIDGTLNAEQFEREIRYGPTSVR